MRATYEIADRLDIRTLYVSSDSQEEIDRVTYANKDIKVYSLPVQVTETRRKGGGEEITGD